MREKTHFAMPLNPTQGLKTSTLLANFAHTQNTYSLKNKMRFAETAMRFVNPLKTDWNLAYSILENKVSIDLSRLTLYDLGPLTMLPLDQIDLSYTTLKKLDVLFESSIRHLDIRGSQINGTMLRPIKSLQSVTLKPKQLQPLTLPGVKIIRKP